MEPNLLIESYCNARIAGVRSLLSTKNKRTLAQDNAATQGRLQRVRTASHKRYCIPRLIQPKKARGDGEARCRQDRRRPFTLLTKHTRPTSEKAVRWLETHLWHAKRFHMRNLWPGTGIDGGYSVPFCRNDRCRRGDDKANRRRVVAGAGADGATAVIHDVSYVAPLVVESPDESFSKIFELLHHFIAPPASKEDDCCAGPSGDNMDFVCGRCELDDVAVFACDRYPEGCHGPARLFCPPREHAAQTARLWVYAHPLFRDQLLTELRACNQSEGCGCRMWDLAQAGSTSSDSGGGGFVRFALRGGDRVCSEVLRRAFIPTTGPSAPRGNALFAAVMRSEGRAKVWGADFPLPLTVSMANGVNAGGGERGEPRRMEWFEEGLPSPLYGHAAETLIASRTSVHERCAAAETRSRAQFELRGAYGRVNAAPKDAWFVANEEQETAGAGTSAATDVVPCDAFPVIVVRKNCRASGGLLSRRHGGQSQVRSSGRGTVLDYSGYDVIVPSMHQTQGGRPGFGGTFASDVWQGLVGAGAQAVGLVEAQDLLLECGLLRFPQDYPECTGSEGAHVVWTGLAGDVESGSLPNTVVVMRDRELAEQFLSFEEADEAPVKSGCLVDDLAGVFKALPRGPTLFYHTLIPVLLRTSRFCKGTAFRVTDGILSPVTRSEYSCTSHAALSNQDHEGLPAVVLGATTSLKLSHVRGCCTIGVGYVHAACLYRYMLLLRQFEDATGPGGGVPRRVVWCSASSVKGSPMRYLLDFELL